MKCFVVFFSFCIAILVGADVGINIKPKASLVGRSYIIQARGVGSKQPPSSPPADRSPRSSRKASPQARTSSDEPNRRYKSPSPEREGGTQSPEERVSKSPKTSANASRPPSPQGNSPPVPSARNSPQPGLQPTDNQPNFAMGPGLFVPPQRIRTNPTRQTQHGQPSNIQPNTASSQARPIPHGHVEMLTSRLQQAHQAHQAHQDSLMAKASAQIRGGQGSVMTSRLGEHGPSDLTANHILGSHARLVASPYQTSVLATNNLADGTTSARATGNSLVSGKIESLDPNGSGVIRVQVPHQAEVKATVQGVGQVHLEAANYNPSAGHARVQADLRGYGWVEAQASQDRLRPDALAAYRAANPPQSNPVPASRDSQQQDARAPLAQGMRRNSDPGSTEVQSKKSRRKSGRSE